MINKHINDETYVPFIFYGSNNGTYVSTSRAQACGRINLYENTSNFKGRRILLLATGQSVGGRLEKVLVSNIFDGQHT